MTCSLDLRMLSNNRIALEFKMAVNQFNFRLQMISRIRFDDEVMGLEIKSCFGEMKLYFM